METSAKKVEEMLKDENVDKSKIDAVVKKWGEKGVLDLEGLSDAEAGLMLLGYHNRILADAVRSHATYSSLLANPPHTLAWVAKTKMQQLEDAKRVAETIEEATKEAPNWNAAECHLCDSGPCKKLCERCKGHCLGHVDP